MTWILTLLLILSSIGGWSSLAWGEGGTPSLNRPEYEGVISEFIIWQPDESKIDELVRIWVQNDELKIQFGAGITASQGFLEFMKLWPEFYVIERSRLKDILRRSKEFIRDYSEPLINWDTGYWHEPWNPTIWENKIENIEERIADLEAKREALKRERELAIQIDQLLKELEEKK